MASPILHIKIQSPEGLVWEGQGASISSENLLGPFDILPQHARFITIIQEKEIRIQEDKEVRRFSFPRALMFVQNDEVAIYTGL
jgi:F0F1-type ATP synthase epsilon subunit